MQPITLARVAVIAFSGFCALPDAAANNDAATRAAGAQLLATREAYIERCASCHGTDGTGGTARVDFGSPEAVANMTRDGMIAGVGKVHAPDSVTAWRAALGHDGLPKIVDYIREFLMLPAPAADASVGRKIYARTCSVCHGERGNGASWAQNSLNPPPVDFRSKSAGEMSRQRMIHAVTYGVKGTAMMPFATQFAREELAAVVDYIRATFMAMDAEPAPAAQARASGHSASGHDHGGHVANPDAGFPIGLIGNAAAGETLYRDNCVACHGLEGGGDGPRAYFMRRKPKDFTDQRSRAELDRPHLFEGIAKGVRGSDMPAWSKVLTMQQIADVAEYVYVTFAEARPGMAGEVGAAAHTSEDDVPHAQDAPYRHDDTHSHDDKHGHDDTQVKKN